MRTDYAVYFTLKSRNSKIGPMPVSTIADRTCPKACPLMRGGCYAKGGPLAILWAALSRHAPGATWTNSLGHELTSYTWDGYCQQVAALPDGTAHRYAQAGDLPGIGDTIDVRALRKLAKANRGKRGYAYSHKPVIANDTVPAWQAGRNATAIAQANDDGFTINLSANHVSEIDALVALNIAPVVTVLPASVHGKQDIFTPAGTRVVVCPATYREDVRCIDCMLCQKRDRTCVVGFPAHGASARKADAIALDLRQA